MDALKSLLRNEKIRFYIDSDEPEVMFERECENGVFRCTISLKDEGNHLQFRTEGYLNYPPDHPNVTAVLIKLNTQNYCSEMVKFTFDFFDNFEIFASVDISLKDNTLTQEQFKAIVIAFFTEIDGAYPFLKKVIEMENDSNDTVLTPEDEDYLDLDFSILDDNESESEKNDENESLSSQENNDEGDGHEIYFL